jgi:hypothetical protein
MADSNNTTGSIPLGGAFTPSAFVEQVTAAVLPLVDENDGTVLREGKTLADVADAVVPPFGHYTVEDAVFAHRMLKWANAHWSEHIGRDDPRAHAIVEGAACPISAARPR